MIKNTLLFLLSFSLSFFLPLQRVSLVEAQDFVPPEQSICNFTPGVDQQVAGDVTLANNCVIYEDVNGTSNGDIILDGNNITLYRTMVWYPGYEIRITNGATIYVNSNAQIVQNKLCLKDEDGDGIPAIKQLLINPTTGATISPTPPPTSLMQLDMIVANPDGTCPQTYVLRETLNTIAYADIDDRTAPDSAFMFTNDAELLRLGFEIDGVTDVLALPGDIIVGNSKNLLINDPGKLGLGLTNPTWPVTIQADSALAHPAQLVIQGTNTNKHLFIGYNTTSDYGGIQSRVESIGGTYIVKPTVLNPEGGAVGIGLTNPSESNALQVGPSNFIVTSGGNVGIGVTNPGYKLSVTGSGNDVTSGSISASNTSATTGAASIVNFSASGASGYFGAFASTYTTIPGLQDRVALNTNSDASGIVLRAGVAGQDIRFIVDDSTEDMRIASGGNVGIGVTNPATSLSVKSDANQYGINIGGIEGFALGEYTGLQYGSLAGSTIYGGIRFTKDAASDYSLRFFAYNGVAGGAERMTIKGSSGRVGIGQTAPDELLQIAGPSGNVGAHIAGAYIGDYPNSTYWAQFSHYLRKDDSSRYAIIQGESGETYVNSGAPALSLRFNATEEMTINGTTVNIPNNNLTISGTISDPSSNLSLNDAVDIAGNLSVNNKITTPDSNNPYLVLDSSAAGGNNAEQSAQISLGESGRSSASLHLAYTGDGYSYIGMGDLGADNIPDYWGLKFYYTNNTVTAGGSFQINGNGLLNNRGQDVIETDATDYFRINQSGSYTNGTAAYGNWEFGSGNVHIGSWTVASYKLQVSGTLYASGSSRDFKENIKPLEIDSSKIYQLQARSYDYKDQYKSFGKILSGPGRQFGFIAEEVYDVIPELAISDGTKPIANVDYEKIGVLLVEEMKKQKARIDQLEIENQTLKTNLEDLDSRLRKLENAQ